MDDNKKLGGNIELAGFRDLDGATMVVLKKIVGNHAKRIEELADKLELLHLTLKQVHEREKSEKYEIHAKIVDDGKVFASDVTDRNLFVAVDNVLKKITNEMD
ncbi:hypothetical protein CMO83_04835 [Candidatus Woesearchaeota archaeon]|jgi:ribosome-associated translation inhibitor RaiA|nr:hypothetical protein [Candidatus Woesearchaeota archaeon]MDP6648208.1 hypothetical protein [Candidatus Woesearchaeota archaeon]|tara:strand:- start:35997 stop:36305 length:309 start_codon:yes stop_codon:yes gene_type:complete